MSTTTHRSGFAGRALAAAGLAAVALVAGAGAASAHVEVSGVDATQGGYGVLTFRVPSESATASTTELKVTFPAADPIVSVDPQTMPGWKATVTTKKLATPVQTDDGPVNTYVAQVDWKAESRKDAIPPGQFQMFNVSVGPLPKTATVSFPALQYYSDGSTVNWNETAIGGAEAEHPAPVLDLAASGTAHPATSGSMPGMDMSSSSSSGGSSWPGIVGLIAGVLGLITGGLALARTNRAKG